MEDMAKKKWQAELDLIQAEVRAKTADAGIREIELEEQQNKIKTQLLHNKMEASRRNIECLCKLLHTMIATENRLHDNDIVNAMMNNVAVLNKIEG